MRQELRRHARLWRPTASRRPLSRHLQVEQQVLHNKIDERGDSLAGLAICEQERLAAAHKVRIAFHDVEARTDVRREISLVDDQDVRLSNPWPVLARDLVTRSNVNDIDKIVDQRR